MKRIYVILFFMCLSLQMFPQGTRFSIIAAPQLTWMKPDDMNVENQGIRPGIEYGLNLDKFFSENAAFHTGITLTNLGGKLKFKDPLIPFEHSGETDTLMEGTEITYKLQYVNIPLGLKFITNEIGYLTYYGNIGINPQIRVKSQADLSRDGNPIFTEGNETEVTNTKINKEMNLFNMGYHIGAGIQYSLGINASLLAGLTYYNGFLDVTKNRDHFLEDKIIINGFTLNLGIMF